jgi:hypothetical protein
MLSPAEFFVGSLGDASGLTLVLPRGKYDCTAIVSQAGGTAMVVFLEGQFRFSCFDCTGNDAWKGVLIPNVRLEVDETSAEEDGGPLGALVRRDTRLVIRTKSEHGVGAGVTPLLTNLTPGHQGMVAAFTRWCIVIGEGVDKRELKTVDVSRQNNE